MSPGEVAEPFEVEAKDIELEADGTIDVATAHFTVEPYGTTGWHRHPEPPIVTVIAGELTRITGDCARDTFVAGRRRGGTGRHVAR